MAIARLFGIKEAVATAQPYSVSVLAQASEFLYNDGCLCYVHGREIRVLDVHNAGSVERVINIDNFISRVYWWYTREQQASTHVRLMHYNEDILAFLVNIGGNYYQGEDADEPEEVFEHWLIAMDLRQQRPGEARTKRLRLVTQLEPAQSLFVRHNRSYLYYGLHCMIGCHVFPRNRWCISCVDLRSTHHVTKQPVILDALAGHDIGQTVCFEMHHHRQGSLYAVSNAPLFGQEEADLTSFYTWTCISPNDNGTDVEDVEYYQIWRRQHREGPLCDLWNDISLRRDEESGRPVILECRREWIGGGSENHRTYYMQPLPAPGEASEDFSESLSYSYIQDCYHQVSAGMSQLPAEPLAGTIDPTNRPSYAPPRKRLRRHFHPEYEQDDITNRENPRHFILARTKHRTYHLSASAFIDLVNDPFSFTPSNAKQRTQTTTDRLRLRVVSRKRKSPIDYAGEEGQPGFLYPPEFLDPTGKPVDWSDERFVSRGIRMWPSDDAPWELIKLLCPSNRTGSVRAVADERSLVYSVDRDGSATATTAVGSYEQDIVLVNFDPGIRFSGLRRLGCGDSGNDSTTGEDLGMLLQQVDQPCGLGQGVSATEKQLKRARTDQTFSCFREEPAMHLSFNRGYWLR